MRPHLTTVLIRGAHARRRRYDGGKGFKPLLLYDTAQRALSPHQSTYWADFYRYPALVQPC
jgi:hypothetical protein